MEGLTTKWAIISKLGRHPKKHTLGCKCLWHIVPIWSPQLLDFQSLLLYITDRPFCEGIDIQEPHIRAFIFRDWQVTSSFAIYRSRTREGNGRIPYSHFSVTYYDAEWIAWDFLSQIAKGRSLTWSASMWEKSILPVKLTEMRHSHPKTAILISQKRCANSKFHHRPFLAEGKTRIFDKNLHSVHNLKVFGVLHWKNITSSWFSTLATPTIQHAVPIFQDYSLYSSQLIFGQKGL